MYYVSELAAYPEVRGQQFPAYQRTFPAERWLNDSNCGTPKPILPATDSKHGNGVVALQLSVRQSSTGEALRSIRFLVTRKVSQFSWEIPDAEAIVIWDLIDSKGRDENKPLLPHKPGQCILESFLLQCLLLRRKSQAFHNHLCLID